MNLPKKINPCPITEVEEHQIIREQIDTLHRFVSNLIENIQDLQPQYSQLVDKYFWELA